MILGSAVKNKALGTKTYLWRNKISENETGKEIKLSEKNKNGKKTDRNEKNNK